MGTGEGLGHDLWTDLPLPLLEGVGGRGSGSFGAAPSPNPLPQVEGEVLHLHSLCRPHCHFFRHLPIILYDPLAANGALA